MNRKPRSDSALKTLPEDRQAAIADYARTHSLQETVTWLREDGVRTSITALSSWLSWWSMSQIFRQSESDAQEFREWLAKEFPKLSEDELDQRAALRFQFDAMRSGDPDTYLAFATARHRAKMDKVKADQKERSLALDERRLSLLEKKAAQADAAAKVVDSKLTPEEKLSRMRQIFGMPT